MQNEPMCGRAAQSLLWALTDRCKLYTLIIRNVVYFGMASLMMLCTTR